jgi:hypothetical protein
MAELTNPSERFPNVNRRELLGTAAGIGAASLASNILLSETEPVVSAQTVPTASPALLNVSAATARRLAAIQCRNLLRKHAGLPLIPVAQEWRRLKTIEAAQDYATFAERFRSRVQTKVLARIRRQVGDSDWKPNGAFQGMAVQNEVSERLGRIYERVR